MRQRHAAVENQCQRNKWEIVFHFVVVAVMENNSMGSMEWMALSTCRIDCGHVWRVFNLFFFLLIPLQQWRLCVKTCNNGNAQCCTRNMRSTHMKYKASITYLRIANAQSIHAAHIKFDSFVSNDVPMRELPNWPKYDLIPVAHTVCACNRGSSNRYSNQSTDQPNWNAGKMAIRFVTFCRIPHRIPPNTAIVRVQIELYINCEAQELRFLLLVWPSLRLD